MIQGGDIENGDGTGAQSIYGGEYEDENLGWIGIEERGLVCSANSGKDTNGSQFFITLEPSPHLNGLHTVFGRLVGGEECLNDLARVEVDGADKPRQPVLVSKCGELMRKKNAPAGDELRNESDTKDNVAASNRGSADTGARGGRDEMDGEVEGMMVTGEQDAMDGVSEAAAPAKSRGATRALAAAEDDINHSSSDRGRKRKGDSTDRKNDEGSKARRTEYRRSYRRQSDNVLDEGQRGRPKQRSRERSGSHSSPRSPVANRDPSAGDNDRHSSHSPAPKHRRKRSPSPSRHSERHDGEADVRRRRSLPNQYQRGRELRGEDRYRPGNDFYDGRARRGDGDRYDGRHEEGYSGQWERRSRFGKNQRGSVDEGRLGRVDEMEGRLGGGGGDGGGEKILYKGRGNMRYREP